MKNLPIFIFSLSLLFPSFQLFSADEPLKIYTSGDPEVVDKLILNYKKETGRVVEYVRLSTGEALTRIRIEAKNPKASMWAFGPGIEYAFAADAGLLEPYQPQIDFKLDPKHHDPQYRWTGLYIGVIGFGTNENFLKEKKIPAPTSWEDLLKPEFKGKVAYAYPYTSGTALTILLGVVQTMGEEKAYEYLKKLDGQIHQYTKSGSACVNQAGLGEIAVCVAFAHDILSKGTDKGYPIKVTYPSEGIGFEVDPVAILKNGSQKVEAAKFEDWLFQPTAQAIFESWHTLPFNPKVESKPPTVPLKDLKLAKIEMDWASKNQKRLVERWRTTTGK